MAWLCTITVSAETLLVIKYGISYPWPNPTPNIVIWGWGIAATLVLGGAFVW